MVFASAAAAFCAIVSHYPTHFIVVVPLTVVCFRFGTCAAMKWPFQ